MKWQQGIPKKSGLYWLYIKVPGNPFIQPVLFYAATDTHPAAYSSDMWRYETDINGELIIDYGFYTDKDTSEVCTNDKELAYWMQINQPDLPTTKE